MTKKTKPAAKVSVRKYNIEHFNMIVSLKKITGHSYRRLAHDTGISKSVIGRWLKEPEKFEVSMQPVPTDKDKKNLSKKQLNALRKFKNRIKKAQKADKDAYKGLHIRYETGEYEVWSG